MRCNFCAKLLRDCLCDVPIGGGAGNVSPPSSNGLVLSDGDRNVYHDLWREGHTKTSPTIEWFDTWISRVPNIWCGCRAWLLEYIDRNPPQFNDWHKWIWALHNAVNAKLGKPIFTWEEYRAKWLPWKQVAGRRIGIVSVNYEALGGTETFHQTLVPRLPNVVGFVSSTSLNGDAERLGVPTGQGNDAIASLAAQSDIVISWNIDWGQRPRPRRLIAVHHGSIEDTWGTTFAVQGDLIIAVNPEVADHLRTVTAKPVIHIPPAVDSARIEPQSAVDTHGKKIVLWAHRFSSEKRYQLAIEIAKLLPPDWHMVLTGYRGEPIEPNHRVTILPPTHPGDWLSVASCFLSTTIFEGFGLAVAEAVAAGVPVVSTPTGVASRPGLAVTVPVDASHEEWAAAIVSSESHPLPRRDLFSLDVFLQAWQSVIKQVSQ